jgi:hypothetical protein
VEHPVPQSSDTSKDTDGTVFWFISKQKTFSTMEDLKNMHKMCEAFHSDHNLATYLEEDPYLVSDLPENRKASVHHFKHVILLVGG